MQSLYQTQPAAISHSSMHHDLVLERQTVPSLPFPAVTDAPRPLLNLSYTASADSGGQLGHVKMLPPHNSKTSFDSTVYNVTVLGIPATETEDELDDKIVLEAQNLGVWPLSPTSSAQGISSSVSMGTIGSDSTDQTSPARTQSTAPTSCASSEHRPPTRSSRFSGRSPSVPDLAPHVPEDERKKDSSLRRGLRKIPGFRKKRSGGLTTSSTLNSISSDAETINSEEASLDVRSSSSIKSHNPSWDPPALTNASTHDPLPSVDMAALKRSMDCKELLDLRMTHSDQKARFLEFQTLLFEQLRSNRDALKVRKRAEHHILRTEKAAKVSHRVNFPNPDCLLTRTE
jgi:hypothetical protein